MNVNDIRPDDLQLGQELAAARDVAWLAERRQEFVMVSCPACGEATYETLYEKNGVPFVRCTRCRTQYANPRPPSSLLEEFYAKSENYIYFSKYIFPARLNQRREKLFRPRAQKLVEAISKYGKPGGALLEVGAAYGIFCDEVRALGKFDRIVALEPTPDLAQRCRDLGFETIESPYEKVVLKTPVDVIAHFEVIEHLFDPGDFLEWCFNALVPGGFIVCTCPNIEGLETLTAGAASNAVDHEHINLFSPSSLSHLFGHHGFQSVEILTPGELDIDLLQRALKSGLLTERDVDPVVLRLITGELEIQHRFLHLYRMLA